jgi:hypothetical protein
MLNDAIIELIANWKNLISIFLSSYGVVLALGFQSQIVRDKHAGTAFFTSIIVGIFQLTLYKMAPNSTMLEGIVYILGGAFGIVSSIYAHNIWIKVTGHERKFK